MRPKTFVILTVVALFATMTATAFMPKPKLRDGRHTFLVNESGQILQETVWTDWKDGDRLLVMKNRDGSCRQACYATVSADAVGNMKFIDEQIVDPSVVEQHFRN